MLHIQTTMLDCAMPRQATAPPPPYHPDSVALGTVLGLRYRVLSYLGIEGTGLAWLAEDLRTGSKYTLKILPHLVRDHAPTLKQVRSMAEDWRRLTHPNVVRLQAMVMEPIPFLVTEPVVGRSCHAIQADRRAARLNGGRFTPREVLRFLGGLADALDHAHRLGIQHQDIKPANIVLSGSEEGWVARWTNFGVAAQIRDRAMQLSARGVPAYMAPEQVAGQRADSRTDIYCLGAVLYQLLTGAHPSATVEANLCSDAVGVLTRAMYGCPDLRPSTAGALHRELASAFGMRAAL